MTGGTAPKPVRILLIEDDPRNVALISETFKHSTTPIRLHVAGDGEQAMKFLRGLVARQPTVPITLRTCSSLPDTIRSAILRR
jgi:CheY-like chemotaxis protein